MDSNSDSGEIIWPKIEPDLDNEDGDKDFFKHEGRVIWTSENTTKLIEVLEKDCKELWDVKHPLNKDRNARQMRHEYLANMFGTSVEEIVRKIHNLRTQLNNELRKIKRRQSTGGEGGSGSGWEYFSALSFLLKEPWNNGDDSMDAVNLALAEFQAEEEEEFGAAARAFATGAGSPRRSKVARVAASAPPPLPRARIMMWQEDAVPKLRPGINPDECQIFGDFVASELRTLRSYESRKELKRLIQKAILQVGEEEDVNIITG